MELQSIHGPLVRSLVWRQKVPAIGPGVTAEDYMRAGITMNAERRPIPECFGGSARIKRIQGTICTLAKLHPIAMTMYCRRPRYVNARLIAIVLCLRLTKRTISQIGEAFQRDHTTIVNAKRKKWHLIEEVAPRMSADATPEDWCVAVWNEHTSRGAA